MQARPFPIPEEGIQFPFLHFFWVGPPPETFGGCVGHDIHRVLQCTQEIKKNPMVFWCLEHYVDHYRAKFAGVNIRVCSLDQWTAQPFLDPQDATIAKHIAQKKAQLLDHPHRNRITDRASMKEFYELFILDYYGGFGLDTNIKPHPALAYGISHYQQFCLVKNSLLPHPKNNIDYWLMYAPPRLASVGKPRVSAELLNVYINQFDEKEKIYDQEGYSEKYRLGCRGIIPGFANAPTSAGKIAAFPFRLNKHTYTATIPNVAIKSYHNSHSTTAVLYASVPELLRHEFHQFLNDTPIAACGIEARNRVFDYLVPGDLKDEKSAELPIPDLASRICKVNVSRELFWTVKKGDTARLKELLEAGANLSETVETDDFLDATILHLSAQYPDVEQLTLLLESGAALKTVAKFKQLHLGKTLILTPEIYGMRLRNQLLNAGKPCPPALLRWLEVIAAYTRELEIQPKAKRLKRRP